MAFQVSVWLVPLSLMRIISFWPSTGVPLGAANVPPVARAVTLYWFVVSAVGVIVAADVVAAVRGLTDPFSVIVLVAPLTAEPMLIVVVEPERPAVPILTVLVLPEVVAAVANVAVVVVVKPFKFNVPSTRSVPKIRALSNPTANDPDAVTLAPAAGFVKYDP